MGDKMQSINTKDKLLLKLAEKRKMVTKDSGALVYRDKSCLDIALKRLSSLNYLYCDGMGRWWRTKKPIGENKELQAELP